MMGSFVHHCDRATRNDEIDLVRRGKTAEGVKGSSGDHGAGCTGCVVAKH